MRDRSGPWRWRRVRGRGGQSGSAPGNRPLSVPASHPAFDRAWYERQAGLSFPDDVAALSHLLEHGLESGLSPSPVIMAEFLAPPGRPQARRKALLRLLRGQGGTSRPHPLIDLDYYVGAFPEAATHEGGPIAHLVEVGLPAGVVPHPDLPPDFDLGGFTSERLGVALRQRRHSSESRLSTTYEGDNGPHPRDPHHRPSPWPRPETPVASIVMPVKDRADRVGAAIESVVAQSRGDWELLVVDDGSVDDLAASLARWEVDGRIRAMPAVGEGVSEARNTALRAARGEYIAYLDSDDTWRPNHLADLLAALQGTPHRAAYGDMALHTAGRPTVYRAFHGDAQDLAQGNFIGLPSLVHERALLDEIGMFDSSLRRCVDYDLIVRIATVTDIVHVRSLTCDVDNDPVATGRISNSAPFGDCNRVRARALAPGIPRLHVDLPRSHVGVVVLHHAKSEVSSAALGRLIREAANVGSAVCVVGWGFRSVETSLMIDCQAVLAGGEAVHLANHDLYGLAVQMGATTIDAEIVGVVPSTAEGVASLLAGLEDAFRTPETAIAQPLVLGADGTIVSAGLRQPPLSALATPHLAGQPALDAGTQTVPVWAVTSHVWAYRRSAAEVVGGVDAGLTTGIVSVALSRRLAARGQGCVLMSGTSVRLVEECPQELGPDGPGVRYPSEVPADIITESSPTTDAATAWREIGIEVATWRDADTRPAALPGAMSVATPVLLRGDRGRPDQPRPRLRWAIKAAARPGKAALSYGDWHYAVSLAAALQRQGQHAVVDPTPSWHRPSSYLDDVVLVLRGLKAQRRSPLQVNLLWIISHPELVRDEEMLGYDAVFAASEAYSRKATERGVPVEALLQCTDPSRFSPDAPAPEDDLGVIFVGNSRSVVRPIVQWAIEAGFPPAVYGSRWRTFVDADLIKGEYVPNEVLASYYRHASVVLNDHWSDMAAQGFLSNRLFDLAASAARFVTDPADGLSEVFGGDVCVASNAEQLKDLLGAPREQAFPSLQSRLALAERIRRDHSFDARASRLVERATAIWRARQREGSQPRAASQ